MTAAAAPPAPVLAARALSAGYGRRRRSVVLSDVELEARPGELIALLGRNGAGKSTLLRTLAGLQKPLAGCVELDGEPLSRRSPGDAARRLAVVLTDPIDAAQLTALDVVGLGRAPHSGFSGRLSAADAAAVRRAFEQAGAAPLAERQVASLSDGERQRVMIARALAQEPAVLLLDEPTAFLDLPARVETAALLRRLAHDGGLATVIATHDFDTALRHCDRLWLLGSADRLAVGAPEDLAFSGELARVFGDPALRFDPSAMTFEPDAAPGIPVHVSGDGAAAGLARLALRRAGCSEAPTAHAAQCRVEVAETAGEIAWSADGPGRLSASGSLLGDLSAFARYAGRTLPGSSIGRAGGC